MDLFTLALAIYLACGVISFALRDQKRQDRRYATSSRQFAIDRNVERFATVLAEQRLSRGPTCL